MTAAELTPPPVVPLVATGYDEPASEILAALLRPGQDLAGCIR